MDKKDVELFINFCQFVWMVGGVILLIFDFENEIYIKNGINFVLLKYFDVIGLILFESFLGYRCFGLFKKVVFFYYGQLILVEFENDNNNEV